MPLQRNSLETDIGRSVIALSLALWCLSAGGVGVVVGGGSCLKGREWSVISSSDRPKPLSAITPMVL